ncbi:unnamed protein product [Closterium sp. NIES-65]|nr:unnamed protein product [Closterium sp. NIES-65]
MISATLFASNQALKSLCADPRSRIHSNRAIGEVTEAFREHQPRRHVSVDARQKSTRPIYAVAHSSLLPLRAVPLFGVPVGGGRNRVAKTPSGYSHIRSNHSRSQIHSRRIPVSAALWPWQQEQQQGDKAQRIRSALVGGAGSAAAEDTERSGLRGGEPTATATALTVTVSSSIASIPAADWDACALDAAGGAEKHNPFVSHAFLQCLEESRSACREEGWLPQHLVARDDEERVVGVLPLYLKGHSYGEYVFDHSWANAFMRAGGLYYSRLVASYNGLLRRLKRLHTVDDNRSLHFLLPSPLRPHRHSYGEYVFDHSWANAFMRAGGSYYPKLQSCVPFTPATGPRLLVRDGPDREAVLSGLCQAMKQVADEYGVSSVHVTFPCKDDWQVMARHGFLQRMGMQYHWSNRGYGRGLRRPYCLQLGCFKLPMISSEAVKVLFGFGVDPNPPFPSPTSPVPTIPTPALSLPFLSVPPMSPIFVAAQGLKLLRLRGDDIKAHHWNSFFQFYCNTTNRKWGQTYLTREFFHLLGERLGEKVLLVVAEDETGRMVGGALNLVGGEAVFGRNWGALPGTHYPFLHFEACYYQAIEAAIEAGLARAIEAAIVAGLARAIEAAIEAGLARVEAGAQGEHKLPRGYLPTATYSAHHIPDPAFRSAIAGFLERETVQVEYALSVMDQEANPFKKQPNTGAS